MARISESVTRISQSVTRISQSVTRISQLVTRISQLVTQISQLVIRSSKLVTRRLSRWQDLGDAGHSDAIENAKRRHFQVLQPCTREHVCALG